VALLLLLAKVWKISARAKPHQRLLPAHTQSMVLLNHFIQTKHGTAEPFHFFHMGPMSDVTMLRRLCLADFGHAMSPWHWRWPKYLAHFSPSQAKSRLFAASTPSMALPNNFISSIWVQ
jgi:hypothetical protein